MGLYVKIGFLFASVTKGSTKSMYSVGTSQGMVQGKNNKRYYIHVKSIVLLNCNHDGGKRMLSTEGAGRGDTSMLESGLNY